VRGPAGKQERVVGVSKDKIKPDLGMRGGEEAKKRRPHPEIGQNLTTAKSHKNNDGKLYPR